MKTIKTIMTIVMALYICSFSYSQSTNNTEKIVALMVEKLNGDVSLTDSQKVVLNKYIKTYITKTKEIKESKDKKNNQKIQLKKQANEEYEAFIDSLLTDQQKEQRKLKIDERKQSNISN